MTAQPTKQPSPKQPLERIEILATGTVAPMQGKPLPITEAMLRELADSYDPATLTSPLVLGHPKTDDPAYGWIDRVALEGERLVAYTSQVVPDLAEAVADGRYRTVSASLYPPTHPGNPTPGKWRLKHVGVLGAQVPACKGLQPLQLAEGDADGVITVELADHRTTEEPIVTTKPTQASAAAPTVATVDLAEREAALSAREAALQRREDEQYVDGLVAKGHLLPHQRDRAVDLMGQLDGTVVIEFAEGDGKTSKATARDAFRAFLDGMPKLVELGEAAPEGDAPGNQVVNFTAPPGMAVDRDAMERHAKAVAWQKAHPGTAYADAVNAVS